MDQVRPAFALPGAAGGGHADAPARHDILVLAVVYAIFYLLVPQSWPQPWLWPI